MAKRYPVKILEDDNHVPFIPFVTADAVFINGTDETAMQWFNDRYTKAEVDKMFADLGTVMDFRGVVETESELPESAEAGDVYLVLHYQEGTITHGVIYNGTEWIDMGTPIDLDDYYTKTQVDTNIKTAVDNKAAEERTITTTDIGNALSAANSYTDNSITNLHMENYYNKTEADALYISTQNVQKIISTDSENPYYLEDLDIESGDTKPIIMYGYFKHSRTQTSPNTMYLGRETIYNVQLFSGNHYAIGCYEPLSSSYIRVEVSPEIVPDYVEERQIVESSVFSRYNYITGFWHFAAGIGCGKEPTDDSDVVTLKYLREQVIEPTQKLIARLSGEEV